MSADVAMRYLIGGCAAGMLFSVTALGVGIFGALVSDKYADRGFWLMEKSVDWLITFAIGAVILSLPLLAAWVSRVH